MTKVNPSRESEPIHPRRLNRALLARQHLLARTSISVRDAVHASAGLQSQEPKDPFVALWSRVRGFTREQLLEATEQKSIVRGTYLRGTIHTLSAEDYVSFRALLQPVINRELVTWRAQGVGFEMKKLEPLARALMAKEPHTVKKMGALLSPRFPKAQVAGLARWIRASIPLAMTPTADRWGYSRPPRFVPADAWLGRKLENGSLHELALRALAAIGPASVADLRAWSGLTGWKPIVEALRPKLVTFRDSNGRELFDLPDAPRPHEDTEAPVRFLPEYDNVFLSHEDRERVIAKEHAGHFNAAKNGRRPRAVLIDGFVRASWSSECEDDDASIEVTLLEKMTKRTMAEVSREAEALLRFLEPSAKRFHVVTKELRAPRRSPK